MHAGIIKPERKISKVTEKAKKLQRAVIKQMLSLATAGFGLVAALAWNNVIKEAVDAYVKPYLPQGSGVISLLLYAIIITLLAVTVTLNLSRLAEKVEESKEELKPIPDN